MQKKEAQYVDGEPYWQCSLCHKWLPETSFYHDYKNTNHLKSQCKHCHTETNIKTRDPENARRINREYMRRANQTNPTKFRIRAKLAARKRQRSGKTIARAILNKAVESGKIIKPTNCSQCGKVRKVTSHHDDYSKPLAIRWLCYECHGRQTTKDNGH